MAEAVTQEAPAAEAPAQAAPEAPAAPAPSEPASTAGPDVKTTDWWKAPASKASALVFLGGGAATEKAAAIAEALKLPCHRPADEKAVREILEKDPSAAIFLAPAEIKDPWMRLMSQLRKEPLGRGRRVVVAPASSKRRMLQSAYALPATAVWLPPHDAHALTKVLLASLPCA